MAGYIWIAGDTPGYVNWNRDPTKNALVIYFLPMIGSTDPSVWLPTPTLIELGHGYHVRDSIWRRHQPIFLKAGWPSG